MSLRENEFRRVYLGEFPSVDMTFIGPLYRAFGPVRYEDAEGLTIKERPELERDILVLYRHSNPREYNFVVGVSWNKFYQVSFRRGSSYYVALLDDRSRAIVYYKTGSTRPEILAYVGQFQGRQVENQFLRRDLRKNGEYDTEAVRLGTILKVLRKITQPNSVKFILDLEES